MKYAAILEYDGTDFSGWQSQPHTRNVQDCVEEALSSVADAPIQTICAGRTDAGVHAVAQVIHFSSEKARTFDEWRRGANALLPPDVSIYCVKEVADDFHARFSAEQRYYRYVILNGSSRRALARRYTEHIYQPLDIELMRQASRCLIGEHDFSSFRAAGCQSRTPVRRLSLIDITRREDFIFIDVGADAFLQHMVRNIVGTLIAVGSGEAEPEWVEQVLSYRDRTRGGVAVSGAGLYLIRVDYADKHQLKRAGWSDNVPFSG